MSEHSLTENISTEHSQALKDARERNHHLYKKLDERIAVTRPLREAIVEHVLRAKSLLDDEEQQGKV